MALGVARHRKKDKKISTQKMVNNTGGLSSHGLSKRLTMILLTLYRKWLKIYSSRNTRVISKVHDISSIRLKLFIALLTLFFSVNSISQTSITDVPAFIDFNFVTTVALQKTHHPWVAVAIAPAPVQVLYDSIGDDDFDINKFELSNIRLLAPNIDAPDYLVKVTLSYQISESSPRILIGHSDNIFISNLKNQYFTLVKDDGFQLLSDTLNDNITGLRTLDSFFFVLTFELDPQTVQCEASCVPPSDLNALGLEFININIQLNTEIQATVELPTI
jgi:hypothetical protein